ncbi:MAG: HlyC/CorC family transporter [Clostridia bacterium]|nr:HlyC/CorC family transporter [Clostridia bacterium]
MEQHIPKLIALVVLILMSAYFSATETAFSTMSKIRLKNMASDGNKKAKKTLDLASDYDKLLSTILVGNNIVNICASAIATVMFIEIYGDMGATISTVVMTVAVLIFGEISPKSMAKESPESFAMFATPMLRFFALILAPVNYIFSLWKKLLSKIFNFSEDHGMTSDELMVLVDEVAQEGSIDEDESELIRNAIEFTERSAEDILTPRIDLEAIPSDATKEEVAVLFKETRFSRLLVYEDSIDDIVGVIHLKDFYTEKGITGKKLSEIMTEPVFVPKSIMISDLLKYLQKNKSHIAVVSDDYGGTLGIVTMEDILEELVGEIWDEHDDIIETFTELGNNKFKVLCNTDLDTFLKFFDIGNDEENMSVNGWVMDELGKIPEVGDKFSFENLDVTVTETDDRRVVEIEVLVNEVEEEEE